MEKKNKNEVHKKTGTEQAEEYLWENVRRLWLGHCTYETANLARRLQEIVPHALQKARR